MTNIYEHTVHVSMEWHISFMKKQSSGENSDNLSLIMTDVISGSLAVLIFLHFLLELLTICWAIVVYFNAL